MIHTILKGAVAAGDSNPILTKRKHGKEGLIQVALTGVASMVIKGRVSPDAPWITLDTIITSTIKWIALTPEMLVTVTGVDGAITVSVWLEE